MNKSDAVVEAVTHSSNSVTAQQEDHDNEPCMLALKRVVENIYAADGDDGIQKLLRVLPLPLPRPEEDREQEEDLLLRDVMPRNYARPLSAYYQVYK